MPLAHRNSPPPDLRIVPTEAVHVHEKYDYQRAQPLIGVMQQSRYLINPPIVTSLDTGGYVVLDGANRRYAFGRLGYPHMLVQVVSYDSGLLELDTWKHVLVDWQPDRLVDNLREINDVTITEEQNDNRAVASVFRRDGQRITLLSREQGIHKRHAVLHDIVRVYQEHATLHRTAASNPQEVWQLFPLAIALVVFPLFAPEDILSAAHHRAYLPSGITRHIVHGRALGVNYPLELLRDETVSLEEKNVALSRWLQQKIENRQVRYYSESTYQFNEYCER